MIIALTTSTAQIGHLEANQSVNIAQMNGVTTTMGNGASGQKEEKRQAIIGVNLEGTIKSLLEAFRDELVRDHAAQIVGRLGLHARGDFFREKFKQKIGHQAAPPASVWIQASPQAFANSRTRRM